MENSITIKLITGFFILLIVFRVLGKKELSQLTPIDFIYLLVLGGLVEESIYDETIPFWKVIYSVLLWATIISSFEFLVRKYDKLRPIVKGRPSIIINNGELNIKELHKNKLESEQLRSLLRRQGIFSIKEVKYAILEPGGQISVMQDELFVPVQPKMLHLHPEKEDLSYLVIDEGRIVSHSLSLIKKDVQWLMTELNEKGFHDLQTIFYAEWSTTDGLCVIEYPFNDKQKTK